MTVQELIADVMKSLNVRIDGRTKAGRAERRLRRQRVDALNKALADFNPPPTLHSRLYFSKISDPNVW